MIHTIREKLFRNPFDSILTLIILGVLTIIIPNMLDWLLFSADFLGETRQDCNSGGACWVYIKVRMGQILFGFYDVEERWRPIGSFFLFLGFLFFASRQRGARQLASFLGSFFLLLFLTWGVIWGAIPGLSVVATDQWGGLLLTLVISFVGILASLPLGILLALGRRSKLPVLRWLCIGNIEFWRGVPLITVLFMASVMLPLFLPPGVNIDKLVRCLLGVTLFSSAYMAEVVRGGLQAIPQGQYQAAKALGLSYWQRMGLVILPQALKHVIPGIVNTFIGLFKDTTLVLIVGLFDLLGVIQSSLSDPDWLGYSFEAYIFIALVYFVFCFTMSRISSRLEARPEQ